MSRDCRFVKINRGDPGIPRSCAVCQLGPCDLGLPDPHKRLGLSHAASALATQSDQGPVIRAAILAHLDTQDSPRTASQISKACGHAHPLLAIVLSVMVEAQELVAVENCGPRRGRGYRRHHKHRRHPVGGRITATITREHCLTDELLGDEWVDIDADEVEAEWLSRNPRSV